MPTAEILIWGLVTGATVCASGPGISGEICKQESAGEALFSPLTPGAVYKFTAKANGSTWSVSHTAPVVVTSDWHAKYEACAVSDFQKWDLITKLRRACGKKCNSVR